MSHKQNTEWLEAAQENLNQAIDSGNYALAKDIIADTFDAGFAEEARAMSVQLRNTPVEKFSVISPIQQENLHDNS